MRVLTQRQMAILSYVKSAGSVGVGTEKYPAARHLWPVLDVLRRRGLVKEQAVPNKPYMGIQVIGEEPSYHYIYLITAAGRDCLAEYVKGV